MTLLECMTLAEIFATTIFSVKLMHDCIHKEACVFADYNVPQNEFDMYNSVVCDGIPSSSSGKNKEIGVNTVCFDTHEELVWTGTKTGHVTSYYGTQLQKYTSFKVHPTEDIRNILTFDHSLYILTQVSGYSGKNSDT